MAFDFRRIWWKNKVKHMLNHLAILANTFYIIYYEPYWTQIWLWQQFMNTTAQSFESSDISDSPSNTRLTISK